MRKVIMRAVLLVLAVVTFSSPAQAALIPIGWLQWEDLEGFLADAPAPGQFSIVNQSGINQTDDFPVLTLLSYTSIALDVTKSDDTHDVLGMADFTDNGQTLDSNNLYLQPKLAELTGGVAPGLVTLLSTTTPAWNGAWNILTGTFVPVPVVVNPGQNLFFDRALIFVEADPVGQAVPEPMTLTLVGTGLAIALFRRHRAARR